MRALEESLRLGLGLDPTALDPFGEALRDRIVERRLELRLAREVGGATHIFRFTQQRESVGLRRRVARGGHYAWPSLCAPLPLPLLLTAPLPFV